MHHGRHNPTSLAAATAPGPNGVFTGPGTAVLDSVDVQSDDGQDADEDGPGRIVREKEHSAEPTTIDQALHEMELVGHDFYLFQDADTGRPSVVYRRHGYDYGVIRLAT